MHRDPLASAILVGFAVFAAFVIGRGLGYLAENVFEATVEARYSQE